MLNQLVLAGNTLRYFVIGDVLKTGVAEVLSAQQSSVVSRYRTDRLGEDRNDEGPRVAPGPF